MERPAAGRRSLLDGIGRARLLFVIVAAGMSLGAGDRHADDVVDEMEDRMDLVVMRLNELERRLDDRLDRKHVDVFLDFRDRLAELQGLSEIRGLTLAISEFKTALVCYICIWNKTRLLKMQQKIGLLLIWSMPVGHLGFC